MGARQITGAVEAGTGWGTSFLLCQDRNKRLARLSGRRGFSGAFLLGVFRDHMARLATGELERGVLLCTRFKRFFYVGLYVGYC